MTLEYGDASQSTWRDLSGVQLLVWPIVIVFMLQYLLAGRFEQGGGLLGFLGLPFDSVWAAGALGTRGVVVRGEWWRLVCSLFLHFSVVHVGMNMLVLVSLGRVVELLYGRPATILIFVLSGLGGTLLSFAWTLYSDTLTLRAGASGAICGFLGLLLAHMRSREDASAQLYARSLLRWTLFLAIWSLFPGISLADHLGGFVTGFVLGKALPTAHFAHLLPGRRHRLFVVSAWLAAGLCVAALVTSGLGARTRLADAQSAEAFMRSLVAASQVVNEDRMDLADPVTAIGLQKLAPGLEGLRKETLEKLRDPQATPTETKRALNAAYVAVHAWWSKTCPDLPWPFMLRDV